MSEELWARTDHYLAGELLPDDPVLDRALAANAAAGLPAIDVSPLQGKFLYLLAKLMGARHILEIGTLGGYSTIWMARALSVDGGVISLELEEKHAQVARANIAAAGLADRVEVKVGPALESLVKLSSKRTQSFDLVFIDADKVNTLAYFEHAIGLCRSGAVIVADNVVRKGQITEEKSEDISVQGMRRFVDALSKDRRIEASALQTVGVKGYDGFIVMRVL
ncbi:MAG TPA: O-methyltransferase [Lacunisphaera sp.]|jgi:predicted O-methyltransferase YrrM